MNNKKVQANMQINVSFLADSQKLVKELNNIPNQLHLSNKITEQLGRGFNTTIQNLSANLNKMLDGLSKPGLNAKQYTSIFDNFSLRIQDNIKDISTFGEKLERAYSGVANKKARDDLRKYEKDLQRIKELISSTKGAETRSSTSKNKFKEEFGIDFDAARSYIESYKKSKAATKGRNVTPTPTTKKWMEANNFDNKIMQGMIVYLNQILGHEKTINAAKKEGYELTKKQTLEMAKQEALLKVERQKENTYETAEYKADVSTWKNLIPLLTQTNSLVDNQLRPGFSNALKEGSRYAQEMTEGMTTLRDIFGQFGIYLSVGSIAQYFKRLGTEAFNFYKSLDSALNEIYVVSNLTSSAINGLTNDFINMAKETGMALDNVTRSATLFYQQGLNTSEVMTMTEVTAQFAKVAGVDATKAADQLTAAVNGYCLAAEDAASVADKFNKVAAASAADINELSTAFSKAAAQANQAGVGMDNYLAYIATMVEATREAPENIGTSLKTIFSRMQQVKEAGTTEDGETDVNKVETALESVGIALRDTSGELRDLEDVFDELGPKWQSLDRNTQAYLGTIIAGTRQQSRFITLMQNWDRVLDLSEQSANSAGMQALMHAKAMDSITSKLQVFKATWQEFISNLGSSEIFKTIIEGLTGLLDLFNSGQQPLALMTMAIGLFSKQLKSIETYVGNSFKDFWSQLTGANNGDGVYEAKSRLLQEQAELAAAQLDLQKAQSGELQFQVEEAAMLVKNKEQSVAMAQKELKIQKQMRLKQNVSALNKAAGFGLTSAGMIVSNKDEVLGGTLTGAGSAVTGIGMLASGQYIAGIVSLASGLMQLYDTWKNLNEINAKKLNEAVDELGDSLQEYNNINTGIRATENLIEKYQKLNNIIGRTVEEQEELNSVIQQLGDTYDIETVADSYGNLSINMNAVNKALDDEKKERAKKYKELINEEKKQRKEASSGLMNSNTNKEFYEQYFSENRSAIIATLDGVEDGLTDRTRDISANVADAFSSNLKTNIVDTVEDTVYEGVQESQTERVKKLNDSINKSLSKQDWNAIYGLINALQSQGDDLTFAKAQQQIDEFYDNWHDKMDLTGEEWNILIDTINGTVFENNALLNFFQEMEKYTEDYYKNSRGTGQIDIINAKLKDIKKELVIINDIGLSSHVLGENMNRYGHLGAVLDDKKLKELEGDKKALEKEKAALEKEMADLIKKYQEDNSIASYYEAEQELNAKRVLVDVYKQLNTEAQKYLGTLNTINSVESLPAEHKVTYAKIIADATKDLGNYRNDTERTNALLRILQEQLNDPTLPQTVKEKLQGVIDEAFGALTLPDTFSWKDLYNDIDSITDNLRKTNEIMDEFVENGGISLETFGKLADILDSINMEDLLALNESAFADGVDWLGEYASILDHINLGFDENTGQLTANENAMAGVAKLQQLLAKIKLQSMKSELQAQKIKIESELDYIEAQRNATQFAIDRLKNETEAQTKTADIEVGANRVAAESYLDKTKDTIQAYKNDSQNSIEWSRTIVAAAQAASEAVAAYANTWRSGKVADFDAIKNEMYEKVGQTKWLGTSYELLGEYGPTIDENERAGAIKKLEDYMTTLDDSWSATYIKKKEIEGAIVEIDELLKKDLSNLGGDAEKLQEYIGQLKEIYNILNRIQNLEHRLQTLDSYGDLLPGENYGANLKERMGYIEELTKQYSFLTQEQKRFTNGYKDFIEQSAVGHVFDFDKYGQIIINFDEYTKLQNTASKGNKSLLEQADEMYKTYTEMYKELQEYFDDYIDYLGQMIEKHEEIIEAWTTMEDSAAEAIKEIYQQILDDRLDAIDKEIDAIDDLREAREEARKEQANAEAVSDLQTNMQRAMMDTSGASDISFIKAQKDMNDKLDEIANDKYSQMLDDITTQLEDEKEIMQDEFDALFENLDWLYAMMETELLNNQDRLFELFSQTEEWNQASPIRRKEMIEEWSKTYSTYAQALSGGNSIADIWDNLIKLKEEVVKADEKLKDEVSNQGLVIARAIENGVGVVAEAVKANKAVVYNTYNNSPVTPPKVEEKDYEKYVKDKGWISTEYYTGELNKDAERGTFSAKDKYGKEYQPNNVEGSYLKSTYAKVREVGLKFNSSGVNIEDQWIWRSDKGEYWIWNGSKNSYELIDSLLGHYNNPGYYTGRMENSDGSSITYQYQNLKDLLKKLKNKRYFTGGFADFTGPAWLDGTPQKPEAVLNALQTEHFIKFTNALDKMFNGVNTGVGASSISIENISFNVDSMSSVADGEKAFDAFVNKFKEIGNQKGIKINSFKNTL